jgi:hypothetical protein
LKDLSAVTREEMEALWNEEEERRTEKARA